MAGFSGVLVMDLKHKHCWCFFWCWCYCWCWCSTLARVCNTVLPSKDVDGFTSSSLGALVQGRGGLLPCTALAVRCGAGWCVSAGWCKVV